MTRLETNIILFCVVLCSSVSVLFECSLPTDITPQMFLLVTCGMAAPLVAGAGIRHIRQIKWSTIWKSLILAVILSAQIVLEWDDCTYLSPAMVSAYGALQILFVPIFMRVLGKKITKDQAGGILLVVVGIMLMRGLFQSPDALMYRGHHNVYEPILSTLAVSVLIVATSLVVRKEDPIAVTVLQLVFATAIGGVWYLLDPGVFRLQDFSVHAYSQMFVVAFFGTGLLFFLNNVAQRYADVTDVAIVTSLEPFALVLMAGYLPAIHFSNYEVTVESFAGACVVAMGAMVAGSKLVDKALVMARKTLGRYVIPLDQADEAGEMKVVVQEEQRLSTHPFFNGPVFKFLLVTAAFVVIAAPFKGLEIISDVTELRPANAVPYLAGMVGGLPGAFGSSLGNLLADGFGTLSVHSFAGAYANFFAAWIPYRLWHLLRDDAPNIKTWRATAVASLACVVTSAIVALIIGFSYEMGQTGIGAEVTKTIFLNQLVFSLLLGPPFLAVVVKDAGFVPAAAKRYFVFDMLSGKLANRINRRNLAWALVAAFVAVSFMAAFLAGELGMSYLSVPVFAGGVISFCLFIVLCI